jgi:hypothetical protein
MIIRYNAGTYMIALVWLNIEYPTPISGFRSTVPTSIFIIPCSMFSILRRSPLGIIQQMLPALKCIVIKNIELGG